VGQLVSLSRSRSLTLTSHLPNCSTPKGLLERLLHLPPSQQLVGLMAQGFQRALGPEGEVLPLDAPSQQLLVRLWICGIAVKAQLPLHPSPPTTTTCTTCTQTHHRPPHPPPQDGLAPHVSLFLSDVETDSWPPGALHTVAAQTARTLVTLGHKGADEYLPGGGAGRRIPPVKVRARVCVG